MKPKNIGDTNVFSHRQASWRSAWTVGAVLLPLLVMQHQPMSNVPNNRFEFARFTRPTRNGEAPLLAAQAETS
jgi:hypothetical protein